METNNGKRRLSRKEIEELELEYLKTMYGIDSPEVEAYKERREEEFNNRVSNVFRIATKGALLAGAIAIGVKLFTGGKKN